MMPTIVFENAVVIGPQSVSHGWVAVADGRIVEVGEGQAPQRGIDFGGDYLMPGLVELHTDHLEAHMVPRPNVEWHPLAAALAYDAQIAASGITTVFDSVRVGSDFDSRSMGSKIHTVLDTIAQGRAQGLFRADHKLHLRCEICTSDVVETTRDLLVHHSVGMMSLMDHTPTLRQFRSVARWKSYFGGKSGLNDRELDDMARQRLDVHNQCHDRHRAALVKLGRDCDVVLASHDDTTLDHVTQSQQDGVSIAEFPTTLEAAAASHARGIQVLMGAPNIVRRGSHSGNVAAADLAGAGILDILSSDYVPSSLLMGAFALSGIREGFDLASAIATVTSNPARATGLMDRGAIAAGLKADLIRVRLVGELPIVREVYRDGQRVV